MKKSLIALSLLAAFAVNAQTANSGSNSGSNSGADSSSTSGINASNSGNVSATGNQNASRSDSASLSGAQSGSQSGAMGNNVTLNQNVPSEQRVNSTVNGATTSTNNTTVNGQTTNNDNVRYSGVVENRTSGGTNSTIYDNVHYSGTQTIKNVPGIAMSGPASGPCTGVSGGLGLAGPGWGIGLNGANVEPTCVVRENVRVIGMAMQSLDGAANPQEKGEITVMFMDSVRGLAEMNRQLISKQVGEKK